MNEKRALEVIDKLTVSTKSKKLEWGRLSDLFYGNELDNPIVKNYILKQERGFYYNNNKRYREYNLNMYKSYYLEFEKGYILVFNYENNNDKYYILGVQSNKKTNIVELNSKYDYQPKLIQLVFLIEGQVDNHVEYINLLIEKL